MPPNLAGDAPENCLSRQKLGLRRMRILAPMRALAEHLTGTLTKSEKLFYQK
jgi:hypothetical protein